MTHVVMVVVNWKEKTMLFLFRDIFRGQRALLMNMNSNKYAENYKCTKEIFISRCQILRRDVSNTKLIFVTNNVGPNQLQRNLSLEKFHKT